MSRGKDGRVRRDGKNNGKKAKIYRAIKIKGPCPECGHTLQPGDTRCRSGKCNAKFEPA